MFESGETPFTGRMLNPDLQHAQHMSTTGTVATELVPGQSESADTVRYLTDLWNNLCELQELMALDEEK